MSQILCSFTGTAGTTLGAYAVGGEAHFTAVTGLLDSAVLSNANRLRPNSVVATIYYVNNFTPANPDSSADYWLQWDVTFFSIPNNTTHGMGMGVRIGTVAPAGYYFILQAKNSTTMTLVLSKTGVGNVSTPIDIAAPAIGSVYTMRIGIFGGATPTIQCFFNLQGSAPVPVFAPTPATPITSGVSAGLYIAGSASNISDSTGYHADNLQFSDALKVATPTTANLADNGYTGSGAIKWSPYSHIDFTADPDLISVTGITGIFSYAASGAVLEMKVDDVSQSPFTFASNTTTVFALSPVAGQHRFQLINGPMGLSSGTYLQTYWTQMVLYGHSNLTIHTPASAGRLIIIGDSITTGFLATDNIKDAYNTQLRALGRPMCEFGAGSLQLHDLVTDSTTATALATAIALYNPGFIYTDLGSNDYGFAIWNAASFGTAYGLMLDALQTAMPNIHVWCQSPIQRISPASEAANGVGSTLGNYRTQISNAVSTRTAFCTYIEGAAAAIVPDAQMSSDGLHPTTAGHTTFRDFVHALLPRPAAAVPMFF